MQHEENEQITLFEWAALMSGRYPELKWLFHCPNGMFRHKSTAARLKAAGVKPGVPDVCLPLPKGGYHGLWIEMKRGKNKPTEAQKDWLEWLGANRHRVAVCYSWEEAKDVILEYINLK